MKVNFKFFKPDLRKEDKKRGEQSTLPECFAGVASKENVTTAIRILQDTLKEWIIPLLPDVLSVFHGSLHYSDREELSKYIYNFGN